MEYGFWGCSQNDSHYVRSMTDSSGVTLLCLFYGSRLTEALLAK